MKLIRFCFPHKTASMFAHKVLATLSKVYGLPYFSPNNTPANNGDLVAFLKNPTSETVLSGPSRVYSIGNAISKNLSSGDLILDICQIRNPLDIIVSQFFSHGWIHPDRAWSEETKKIRKNIQSGEISVNEYARMELSAQTHFGGVALLEKMEALNSTPSFTKRVIVSYEQFYLDYDAWAKKIADALPDNENLENILLDLRPNYTKAVVLPQGVFYENPLEYIDKYQIGSGKHIRSAAPGDHSHFLTENEISALMGTILATCPILESHYGVNNNA